MKPCVGVPVAQRPWSRAQASQRMPILMAKSTTGRGEMQWLQSNIMDNIWYEGTMNKKLVARLEVMVVDAIRGEASM